MVERKIMGAGTGRSCHTNEISRQKTRIEAGKSLQGWKKRSCNMLWQYDELAGCPQWRAHETSFARKRSGDFIKRKRWENPIYPEARGNNPQRGIGSGGIGSGGMPPMGAWMGA